MKTRTLRTSFFIVGVTSLAAIAPFSQAQYNNTIELRCDGQGDESISVDAKGSPILPPLKYYLASRDPDTWVEKTHTYHNHEMADVPLWTIQAEYEREDGVFGKYPLLINRNIPAGNYIEYTPCKRTTTGCSLSNKFGDHGQDWDFLVKQLDAILKEAGIDDASSEWNRTQAVAHWCYMRRKSGADDWESPRHPVDFVEHGGMCTYSAQAFVAFCSLLEIPARVIRWSHHTCAEAFVDGQWRWVENTVDLCDRMQKQSKHEKGPMFSYSFQEMIADPASHGLPAGTQYDGFTNLRDDRKNEYLINLEGYSDWVFGWIKGNDKPERLIKIESAYELSGAYPEKETIIYKCFEGKPQMYLTPPGEKTWVFTKHSVKIDQDHGLRQRFYLSSDEGLRKVTSVLSTTEMDVTDDGGNWYYVINGHKVYLRDMGGWNVSGNRIKYTIPLEYLNFASVTDEFDFHPTRMIPSRTGPTSPARPAATITP
jgi:hypothetical protein